MYLQELSYQVIGLLLATFPDCRSSYETLKPQTARMFLVSGINDAKGG